MNKIEIALSGDRRRPRVSISVDDQPVDIEARVNGKQVCEQKLLDMVLQAGMMHALDTIASMPTDEAGVFLQGVMEG